MEVVEHGPQISTCKSSKICIDLVVLETKASFLCLANWHTSQGYEFWKVTKGKYVDNNFNSESET